MVHADIKKNINNFRLSVLLLGIYLTFLVFSELNSLSTDYLPNFLSIMLLLVMTTKLKKNNYYRRAEPKQMILPGIFSKF